MYDSKTGYFLWGLVPVPKNHSKAVDGYGNLNGAFVAGDRFIQVAFAYPDLVVKESFQKANSLDDAENKSLQTVIPRLATLMAWNQPDRVITNLAQLLPKGFAATPPQAKAGPFKLVNVLHKGNTWEVIVQGQWQEKITLNEKYQVTGMIRLN